MKTRRYGMRGGRGYRPARDWLPFVNINNSMGTAGVASVILGIEAPALAATLTAAPPEDLTILRVVGNMQLNCTNAAIGDIVSIGIILQDSTWTPSATWLLDGDKRWLWLRHFYMSDTGTCRLPDPFGSYGGNGDPMQVDFTPKVKLEDGKALYLVGYSTGTDWATSFIGRLLTQRSGRR